MTMLFLSLFEISLSISLMVIVLILLTPFFNKRYAVKWKYFIWIFLALRLVVPFSGVNGQMVLDVLSQIKPQTMAEPEEKNADMPTDIAIPSGRLILEIPEQMTMPIIAQNTMQGAMKSGKNESGITILDIVTIVWMTGSLIFIFVHCISYFCYKQQVIKKGQVIEDTHVLCQMFDLKRELHIRQPIQAVEYDKAESPMIIGFLKPVLVLPKEQYCPEELFFILKHELVHLKRGDVYFKFLFVTANAIHWYNPFIWIMQKEAVIDMELSCDEKVTQDASYAMRKAYTETLLSMLHKQCVKKTALSTQFYGGTKIMKKRFKNILVKNEKKNGIGIWMCAVILTISFGTLVGCSVTKEDTEKEQINYEDIKTVSDQLEREEPQTEQMAVDTNSDDNNTLEYTTTLTFLKEGEQEQKQAGLMAGEGYAIYLPEDEWQASGLDRWRTVVNEQVQLWITHFQDESMDAVVQKLEDSGYAVMQDNHRWKQEKDIVYHVELEMFDNDIWGIFYTYPVDSEEGWGRDLPVIADTFMLLSDIDYIKWQF